METTKQDSKKQNWTEDAIATVAKKYATRADFAKNDQSAYQAARRKGVEFLNKVCEHMAAIKRGRKQGQKAKPKTTATATESSPASLTVPSQGVTV
jgi:hypothetical protein